MKAEKNHYELGNILRGWVYGDYETDEEAWKALSRVFNKMFPSEGGRGVNLIKKTVVKSGNSKDRF